MILTVIGYARDVFAIVGAASVTYSAAVVVREIRRAREIPEYHGGDE